MFIQTSAAYSNSAGMLSVLSGFIASGRVLTSSATVFLTMGFSRPLDTVATSSLSSETNFVSTTAMADMNTTFWLTRARRHSASTAPESTVARATPSLPAASSPLRLAVSVVARSATANWPL